MSHPPIFLEETLVNTGGKKTRRNKSRGNSGDILLISPWNQYDIPKYFIVPTWLSTLKTMSPFRSTYEVLAQDFRSRGIPTNAPGFCDDPSFLAVERSDPGYLNNYAAFIAKRPYTPEYLSRAQATISKAASLLHSELIQTGRLGACVDISGILSRILDREGIWNCGVKGSLTVTFPSETGIKPRYFWSVDHGNFVAGHAWVFAPPYTVLDVSVKQQPYGEKECAFLPETVLSVETTPATVDVEDIVSPSARMEMLRHGVPPSQHLYYGAPCIPDIFSAFPPISVPGLHGATLKYSPVAIHAPDGSFEEMRNMTFNGLTPWELYSSKLSAKLHGSDVGPHLA